VGAARVWFLDSHRRRRCLTVHSLVYYKNYNAVVNYEPHPQHVEPFFERSTTERRTMKRLTLLMAVIFVRHAPRRTKGNTELRTQARTLITDSGGAALQRRSSQHSNPEVAKGPR